MSDDRAALRKTRQEKLAGLKSSAIAALENRGYEVRGKTTSQIREILRRHPTKPRTIVKTIVKETASAGGHPLF